MRSVCFRRGDETIVCVWSNEPHPIEVTIKPRDSAGGAVNTRYSPVNGEAGSAAMLSLAEAKVNLFLTPLEFVFVSFRP